MAPTEILSHKVGSIDPLSDFFATPSLLSDCTIAVNARGPFLFCREIMPGMLDRNDGRVINIASVAGLRGLPRRLSYTASKHALVGLTRSLAAEVLGSRVTVNAICPGAVVTHLTAGSRPDQDRTGWLQPDEVAATVRYLAGAEGAHVHGAVIALEDRSGGFTP
jgi:NAD(P)-dependent dehydrogenase (short-subunit alcohol dehydrogenase family)